jgi:hypothetical protein
MSVEIMKAGENGNGSGSGSGADKDTLYMLGGVALVVFGAGLILSNSNVRRYLGQLGISNVASAALPDIEKYFRLRSM